MLCIDEIAGRLDFVIERASARSRIIGRYDVLYVENQAAKLHSGSVQLATSVRADDGSWYRTIDPLCGEERLFGFGNLDGVGSEGPREQLSQVLGRHLGPDPQCGPVRYDEDAATQSVYDDGG